MTRPGSTHTSSCSCASCTGGVIQVVVPGTGGGVQGIQGVQGRTGSQGVQGRQGTQGTTGAGVQGTQGIQGLQGGGASLQDIEDAIQNAALDSTDDLPEGVQNLYFLPSRVAYVFTQAVSNDTWVITHNLGFYPNITVKDSGGSIVEGEISYTNSNSVTVTFSAAFSGTAYLS